jgi:hypothetical protein
MKGSSDELQDRLSRWRRRSCCVAHKRETPILHGCLFSLLCPPAIANPLYGFNDYWCQETLPDLALDRLGKCPVHRTLTSEIRIESRLVKRKKKGSELCSRPCEPRTLRAVARVLEQKGLDKWHKHSI